MTAAHERVLRDVPSTAPPRQLPVARTRLVGRDEELAALDRAAGVVLICGPAGVGRTTLALAWCQRAADRFPDGQLYHLRGFDPGGAPVAAADALWNLLVALGHPAERIPARTPGPPSTVRSPPADGCCSCSTMRARPSRSGRCCPDQSRA